jgi:C1A family cysteine protease
MKTKPPVEKSAKIPKPATVAPKIIPLSNLQPSPPDIRDHIAALPRVTLPTSVDLKPLVNEVENQSIFNSCTANAGCSALELMYHGNNTIVDLSRFYLYYYTRQLSGTVGDKGAYARDIGKALKAYGVCTENNWAYVPENLDKAPTPAVIQEANKFKILSYEQLVGDELLEIKNAVAQGVPVLLTMAVHNGFYALTGDWKTHTWDYTNNSKNPLLGWHEVLIIGYDDVSQRLLVENSWGPGWGDGGFFGISYGMLQSTAIGELWVLSPNYSLGNDVIPDPLPDPLPTPSSNKSFIVIALIALAILIFTTTGMFPTP